MPDLAIRSTRLVLPEIERPGTVLIKDGRVVDVVNPNEIPTGTPTYEAGDLAVMAGLVDSHVHINEPGRTEWEGFYTATRAAAAGGVTTLADMPLNSSPVTTNVAALRAKLDSADGQLWVDCGFYGGLIPGNHDDLIPLLQAGVLGFKAFLIDSGIKEFPAVSTVELHAAMPLLADAGVPLLVHAELESQLNGNAGKPEAYSTYLKSRPRSWELDAIKMMTDLCKEYGCPVHIVHLSAAKSLGIITQTRSHGWPLTVETCPHYLFFESEEIGDGETLLKCAPPIRDRANREKLWQGLRNGSIDLIVSDHSPCTPELKQMETGDYHQAWGGIASLQFSLPIVWTVAMKAGHTLSDISRWMSAEPARLIGMTGRKGSLASGYDADIIVWDPDETFVVKADLIEHRHKITPYEGRELTGAVKATFLHGQKIWERGAAIGQPTGAPLLYRTS